MTAATNVNTSNPLGIKAVDHLEFTCEDLEKSCIGRDFSLLGLVRTQKNSVSELYTQGRIRFLLTKDPDPSSHTSVYFTKHGEGVCTLGFLVESVEKAYNTAIERGAVSLNPPEQKGNVITARIQGAGDIVNEFVQRSSKEFRFDFQHFGEDPRANPLKVRASRIDHLTHNVPYGEMEKWADFYKNIFGFKETRYFDIKGEKTGLNSKVVQLENNAVIIPINQPKERQGKDQIQEFLDINRGLGVQHIALMSSDIITTIGEIQERGIEFLDIPHTYYEDIPRREKEYGFHVQENLSVLEKRKLLVDGDDKGYLIQIFTKNYVGPLFYEFIQRKNHWGFGEGNFHALFSAIERDQMKRGYL